MTSFNFCCSGRKILKQQRLWTWQKPKKQFFVPKKTFSNSFKQIDVL